MPVFPNDSFRVDVPHERCTASHVADHMQATGLANAAFLLLHHGVVFTLHLGDRLAQRLNLGIVGGGFFSSGGNALLQLDHAEGPVAPGLDQITRQLA